MISSVIKSLNQAALRDARLKAHPDRNAGGTKYISTFLNSKGDAIALDLSSGSKNAIFLSAHLAPNRVLPVIERERYEPGRGKNSNVNVPELSDRPLVRLYPSSLSRAREILDYFAEL